MNKRVTLLGATGTIGDNTLDIISQHGDAFDVYALTAQSNVTKLAELAKKYSPDVVVIEDESKFIELKTLLTSEKVEVLAGAEAIAEIAGHAVDILINAIVGAAALPPMIKAIEIGNTIGLANKECLVCGGDLVMKMAKENGVTIIPIDSEHHSIHQLFPYTTTPTLQHITLTASGGPFLNRSRETLALVTPEEAVKHPNWTMGAKISVDSATMMNKGLEMIEAWHLFPVEKSEIDIVIHPESIIHGMVHYKDGSVTAALSTPDMRIPIAYALGWPNRLENNAPKLDIAAVGNLTFKSVDTEQFPAVRLARKALEMGGSAPAVLNAANEEAVSAFLGKQIGFLDIIAVVEEVLESYSHHKVDTLDAIWQADSEARKLAESAISNYQTQSKEAKHGAG